MASAQLAPQQTVGHYVLLEKLGAGGLGEVWKARDQTLARVVALKFVTGETRQAGGARELMREARAASALNHPNIVTVFEVGESQYGAYLAMELVEGQTLRTRLDRGPLALADALDIAAQAAKGLGVAHAHGIIHRDLKPENIMVRGDGYVKLLDFGLAKRLPWAEATAGASATTGTVTGQISGTFSYMSPEQARGLELAPASDVFSFGIVLFELLTGQHPFRGLTVMDTLQNILAREAALSDVPAALAEVVSRALRKDPAERFSDARAVSEALKAAVSAPAVAGPAPAKPSEEPTTVMGGPRPFEVIPTPGWMQALGATLSVGILILAFLPDFASAGQATAALPKVTSVAVLNFRATADDRALAAFGESLSEEVSTALARSGIPVSAQSAVQALGASVAPQDAGQRLKVDAVFAGSIRASGEQVKIRVELVNSANAFQIWSETVTAERRAIPGGEQKTAEEIVSRMRIALSGRE